MFPACHHVNTRSENIFKRLARHPFPVRDVFAVCNNEIRSMRLLPHGKNFCDRLPPCAANNVTEK
jgi:hypothetical protein